LQFRHKCKLMAACMKRWKVRALFPPTETNADDGHNT